MIDEASVISKEIVDRLCPPGKCSRDFAVTLHIEMMAALKMVYAQGYKDCQDNDDAAAKEVEL